jgi:hypothetical protein
LQFFVSIPTQPQFLERFLQAACYEILDEYLKMRICKLAQFFSECSLHYGKLSQYKPSMVALSSVVLALHTCGCPSWTPTLSKVSMVDPQNLTLMNCVKNLFDCITNFPAHLSASRDKYFVDAVPPLPCTIPALFRLPTKKF